MKQQALTPELRAKYIQEFFDELSRFKAKKDAEKNKCLRCGEPTKAKQFCATCQGAMRVGSYLRKRRAKKAPKRRIAMQ